MPPPTIRDRSFGTGIRREDVYVHVTGLETTKSNACTS